MQTITMTAILQKARDLLVADTVLAAWAETNYGKAPTVFVGADIKHMPKEDTMPNIILLPDGKEEGMEAAIDLYRVLVAWCIKDDGKTVGTNTIECDGLYKSDALGQLIWDCLSKFSANCPASRCEYDVDGAVMAPLFPGYMTIEIHVPVVMGATVSL